MADILLQEEIDAMLDVMDEGDETLEENRVHYNVTIKLSNIHSSLLPMLMETVEKNCLFYGCYSMTLTSKD